MGLLDALLSGNTDGGGLLSFLQNNALNQQPAMGLPSDQAQYGSPPMGAMAQAPVFQQPSAPSPLDNAPWPAGPVGAPSQANAQMPVPQQPPAPIMAQPQQDSGPGIGDRLLSGFQGFAAPSAGGLMGHLAAGIGGLAGQETPANLTMKALIAKGVDPAAVAAAKGNPELMKTLITQAYGPQTVQSLGNGYIADKNGKITRAYEPEDKIPSGFAKDDEGNLHFVPGGPADPAYQKQLATQGKDSSAVKTLGQGGELYHIGPDGKPVIDHKNEKPGAGARILSDDGADLMADRIVNGEKGVTTGFARSPADLAEIYNRVAAKAKERGIDASDILSNINNEYAAASAARSFGGMTAKMETYGAQTAKAIDIAEQASKDVPRTNYPDVNKAILAYRNHTGDPKVAALGQAIETLTQEYARAVGGGHGTVADKEEARDYLSKAQSHDQLVARLNVMRNEIARARESVGESAAGVGQIYRNNIRGGAKLPEPNAPPKAPVKIGGYTITEH